MAKEVVYTAADGTTATVVCERIVDTKDGHLTLEGVAGWHEGDPEEDRGFYFFSRPRANKVPEHTKIMPKKAVVAIRGQVE